ncbi:ribosome biogenesis GTPase Der [Patescibacteria group bacterium]|nr:ribosome biogenesis GTPase Der [Patescibacteria group bacterium]
MKSKIIIVGRSNVGKSSLFNKIVEKNQALVLPESGTTRDVLDAEVFWRDKQFIIIDTGGLDPKKDDVYHELIIKHATSMQKKANVILFMVDVNVGVLDDDARIIKQLRKLGKPILLVVNKCDNAKRRSNAHEFEKLGLKMHLISSINGSGIGDLLDEVVKLIPEQKQDEKDSDIKLALIGKPNVGKSSILNSIYGEDRMIVSETPHTTRDSQDIQITYKDFAYTVIDTAGIRRKTKQGDEIEHLSINKSMAAIERAHVVALIIDISENLTSQDHRLAREIEDMSKGLIIIANKWDLIADKDEGTINKYKQYIDSSFPNLSWVPIIFTSAIENKRTKEILSLAENIKTNLEREITDNALDKFIKSAVKKRKPTIGKGTRRPRLLYLKQTKANPPSFLLEIPNKTSLAKSYQQYLINSLREKFDFEGVPVKLTVKQREIKKEEMETIKPRHKRVTHRHRRLVTKNIRR